MNLGSLYLAASSLSWPSIMRLIYSECCVHSDVVWHLPQITTPSPSHYFPACSGVNPCCSPALQQPRLLQISGMFCTSGGLCILDGKFNQIGFAKLSQGSIWKEAFEMKSSAPSLKNQAVGSPVCTSSRGGCSPASNIHTWHAKSRGPHLPVCLPVAFTHKTCFIFPEWEFGDYL